MARLILALLVLSVTTETTLAQESPERDSMVLELNRHTQLLENRRAQMLFRYEHPRPRILYLAGAVALVSSLVIAGYGFGAITGGLDNAERELGLRLGLPGVALGFIALALFIRAGKLRRRLERRFRDRRRELVRARVRP